MKVVCSLKQNQYFKTFCFILSLICQEKPKRGYETEDPCVIYLQLKQSGYLEGDCLDSICQ